MQNPFFENVRVDKKAQKSRSRQERRWKFRAALAAFTYACWQTFVAACGHGSASRLSARRVASRLAQHIGDVIRFSRPREKAL
jgi:hypothetical protein